MSESAEAWIKKGVKLLDETVGDGATVERQRYYVLAIRLTLRRGDVVTPSACRPHSVDDHPDPTECGYLRKRVRMDRENLIGGLFYVAPVTPGAPLRQTGRFLELIARLLSPKERSA